MIAQSVMVSEQREFTRQKIRQAQAQPSGRLQTVAGPGRWQETKRLHADAFTAANGRANSMPTAIQSSYRNLAS